MSSLLITNIKQLINTRPGTHLLRGNELADLPCIENAYLIIENEVIVEYGSMINGLPISIGMSMDKFNKVVDAKHQFVLPCWCDSHTHLVFAGSREAEFVAKIKGMSYEEIAAKGGGILNSMKELNDTSEDELFNQAWKRLEEVSKLGTGAIEIKSGYGLTLEGELKMLRVIKKLKERSSLSIKATFLGAHAYPTQYSKDHQ